jgi:hypothetical protein
MGNDAHEAHRTIERRAAAPPDTPSDPHLKHLLRAASGGPEAKSGRGVLRCGGGVVSGLADNGTAGDLMFPGGRWGLGRAVVGTGTVWRDSSSANASAGTSNTVRPNIWIRGCSYLEWILV